MSSETYRSLADFYNLIGEQNRWGFGAAYFGGYYLLPPLARVLPPLARKLGQ